jgi:hypothetical protein
VLVDDVILFYDLFDHCEMQLSKAEEKPHNDTTPGMRLEQVCVVLLFCADE